MKQSKKKWIPERPRDPERRSRDPGTLAWSFCLRALSPSGPFSVLGLAGAYLSRVGLGGRGEQEGRNPRVLSGDEGSIAQSDSLACPRCDQWGCVLIGEPVNLGRTVQLRTVG